MPGRAGARITGMRGIESHDGIVEVGVLDPHRGDRVTGEQVDHGLNRPGQRRPRPDRATPPPSRHQEAGGPETAR